MHNLSARSMATLRRFAEDGDLASLPASDELRILLSPLGARQAVAVARQADVLWVLIDLSHEDALVQLRDLIRTWPATELTLRSPFTTPAASLDLAG